MALPPADACPTCSSELVSLHITVDNHDLVMNSCETCDTRTWQLAGVGVDLEKALDEVGTHSGRRR